MGIAGGFRRASTHRTRYSLHVPRPPALGPRGADGVRGAVFVVQAVNKGRVEHKFTSILLRVKGVKTGQTPTRRADDRWEFTESILKAQLVPQEPGYFFVRPGIRQSFPFPTTIPADIRHVWVRAVFKYEKSGDPHTIERVFAVSGA